MSEEKTVSLVQLQEAWQKLRNSQIERNQKLKQWFQDYSHKLSVFGYKEYLSIFGVKTYGELLALLSEGSSAEESSFGVLLQRLITELPQQVKSIKQLINQQEPEMNFTTNDACLMLCKTIENCDQRCSWIQFFTERNLVALEGLIPTEKKRLEP